MTILFCPHTVEANIHPYEAAEGLYVMTRFARESFQSDARFFTGFEIGNRAQRALTDFVFDAFTLRAFTPVSLASMNRSIMEEVADAYCSLATVEARRLTVTEVSNKYSVVGFVNDVGAALGIPETGSFSLPRALENAMRGGEYAIVWLGEGIGERYSRAALASGEPRRLLTNLGPQIPVTSLPMLHAGMGIAFAKSALTQVTPYSTERDIDQALRVFVARIRANSSPGYEGAALESLGLVTRTWYEEMLRVLDLALQRTDKRNREFFWHGVGRALYFLPSSTIPGVSPWRAAREEPGDEVARRNARAGIAWAFTLVNRRQPEIVANFLKCKDWELSSDDSFTNGVLSALAMDSEVTPGDRCVASFCGYQPDLNDAAAVAAWRARIGNGLAALVERERAELKADGGLGELFRYRPVRERYK